MKITIYTIPECQFSKTEKEYLASKNIPFEEKNLEANRDFLTEMLTLSNNFAGTPVTKIEKDDGQIVILKGFTKEEFDKELGSSPAAGAETTPATQEGQNQAVPADQTVTPPVTEAAAALDQAAAAVVAPGESPVTDTTVPPAPMPEQFAPPTVADANMPAAPDIQPPAAPTEMTPDMQANFPPPQTPAAPDMNSMNTQQPEMGVIPPADPNAGQMGTPPDQSLNSILNNLEQKVSDTPDMSQPQSPQNNPNPVNPTVPPQA